MCRSKLEQLKAEQFNKKNEGMDRLEPRPGPSKPPKVCLQQDALLMQALKDFEVRIPINDY